MGFVPSICPQLLAVPLAQVWFQQVPGPRGQRKGCIHSSAAAPAPLIKVQRGLPVHSGAVLPGTMIYSCLCKEEYHVGSLCDGFQLL